MIKKITDPDFRYHRSYDIYQNGKILLKNAIFIRGYTKYKIHARCFLVVSYNNENIGNETFDNCDICNSYRFSINPLYGFVLLKLWPGTEDNNKMYVFGNKINIKRKGSRNKAKEIYKKYFRKMLPEEDDCHLCRASFRDLCNVIRSSEKEILNELLPKVLKVESLKSYYI